MTKPETKKAARERQILERIEAKRDAYNKQWAAIMSTPIAKAVEPLKSEAVERAEQDAIAYVEKLTEQLTAAGNDLNVVAPYPRNIYNREEYTKASRRRALFTSITVQRQGSDYSGAESVPCYRDICPDNVATFIERAREAAADQYDQFVKKLVGKIGETVKAELHGSHVWGFSILTITKPDGTVENWKTQQIVNVSVYGLLFNQWPSRKVK